jgi:hypothetical protein
MLCKKCILKHIIEGKIEGGYKWRENKENGVSSYCMSLRARILETVRGSTRSHSVENSLWKRLLTCSKTDYGMNEYSTSLGYISSKSFQQSREETNRWTVK